MGRPRVAIWHVDIENALPYACKWITVSDWSIGCRKCGNIVYLLLHTCILILGIIIREVLYKPEQLGHAFSLRTDIELNLMKGYVDCSVFKITCQEMIYCGPYLTFRWVRYVPDYLYRPTLEFSLYAYAYFGHFLLFLTKPIYKQISFFLFPPFFVAYPMLAIQFKEW